MKLNAAINESKSTKRIPLSMALKIAKEIITKLGLKYVAPTAVVGNTTGKAGWGIPVGSIRQQKSSVGDIDILATKQLSSSDIEKINGTVNISSKGKSQVFFNYKSTKFDEECSINIWFLTDMKYFGGMMMITSGPFKYNIQLSAIAKRQGNKANRYGVFDSSGKQLGGKTEASYYKALKSKSWPNGKEWKAPELRGK